MSRIGKKLIPVPAGVTAELSGGRVTVNGPKGTLSARLLGGLDIKQENGTIEIVKKLDTPETQQTFGLMRTLVDNMIIGVSKGYDRKLEINGVGYKASASGNVVTLHLGFSHPILLTLPEGVEAKVEKNLLTISGYDKQLVGQVAANIRGLKKPEPYKGKGIKYVEEHIRRKAGKTATKG